MSSGNTGSEVRLDRGVDAPEPAWLHGEIIEPAKSENDTCQCGRHGRFSGIRVKLLSVRGIAAHFTMECGFYLRSRAIKDDPIPAARYFHDVKSLRL